MAPSRAIPHEMDQDDDDPVENEYDIFITPPMDESERLYLFQYPTRERDRPYNDQNGKLPIEMRMKQESGFIEVDVPLDTQYQYNREKAQKWGKALHAHRNDGGFGLASGLVNAQGPRTAGRGRGRGGRDADGDATMSEDEPPMATQTLGGRIYRPAKESPQYMLGVFSGEQLHLTPLTGIVQMRPQFHNIDAHALAEKTQKQRQAREAAGPGAGRGAAAEPRAVTMTTKVTTDNEDISASDSKAILERAQQEPWTKLDYLDDEDPRSWAVWEKKLFIPNELLGYCPDLISKMDDAEYLDSISARKHSPGKMHRKKQDKKGKGKESDPVDIGSDSSEADEDDPTSSSHVEADGQTAMDVDQDR